MHVLITGGAGFIGSHLGQKLLSLGYLVTVIDNFSPQIHGSLPHQPAWLNASGCQFIYGDVCNRSLIEKTINDVDAIVHLAAETGTGQSMYEIAHYNYINTQSTALLLDVLMKSKHHRVKSFLLASSRSVYGEGAYECVNCSPAIRLTPEPRTQEQLASHEWNPISPVCNSNLRPVATHETDAIKPASIYAATKYSQEELVRIACQAMGIGFINFRLQNVYGEGQSLRNPYTGILSIFSTRIRRDLSLPIFEDGQETRDFVHISDVVEAFIAGLQAMTYPNTAINVGTGQAISVEAMASKLSLAFGKSPDIVITSQYRVGDIRHNYADISRLSDFLGVKPQIGLEEGLRRFAEWVIQQPLPEDKLSQANYELHTLGLMNQGE